MTELSVKAAIRVQTTANNGAKNWEAGFDDKLQRRIREVTDSVYKLKEYKKLVDRLTSEKKAL